MLAQNTAMFVRWRTRRSGRSGRHVTGRRQGGRIKQEHIAALGSIPAERRPHVTLVVLAQSQRQQASRTRSTEERPT
jgi:hypothetical protein